MYIVINGFYTKNCDKNEKTLKTSKNVSLAKFI